MTVDAKPQVLYLNRENRWLDFEQRGLELRDGQLTLASLPLFETTRMEELGNLPVPDGPAGLAVGDDGTIYFSDPTQHRVLRINPCDGETFALPCLGGMGSQPNSFQTPRGLLFDAKRRALYVADSGNDRIQIFNVDTFQLVDIWPHAAPLSGSSDEPGYFDRPWSLAMDGKGNIYVVDVGNQRVQKFDVLGRVVPSFWNNAAGVLNGAFPKEVAVALSPEGERVVVLALAPDAVKIFIFDTTGQLWRTIDTTESNNVAGLATSGESIYIGDNEHRRILKFRFDGTFVGEARGYNGPVAALAFDQQGGLLVHTGSSAIEILQVAVEGAFGKTGFMWGGPFVAGNVLLKSWFSIKALPDQLPADAHVQMFYYLTDDGQPPAVLDNTDQPFSSPGWRPMPLNVTDGLISAKPHSYIWVALEFSGEGLTSPTLSQLTLEYDHESYLRYFPAIYREDPIKRAFLENFLALYESFFDDTERDIRGLSRLFDTQGAPSEFLSWLAGWLALDLDEHWSEEKQRTAIAKAFDLYGRRGTATGLRESLQFFAGIDAHIEEPILSSSWWALPADVGDEQVEGAMLGFNTTLAPEEAQGAVVGTTATYDQSSLISVEEFGAPLFSNVAHRFVVRLHKAQVGGPKRQKDLEAIIEREKPAHTMAHVCLIEPGIKLGLKAQIGIDSVLGGEPSLARLGASSFTSNLHLGGPATGRLGEQSRVGQTTWLGDVNPDIRSSESTHSHAHRATRGGHKHPRK
jgi:phage tail-like protein